MVAEVSQPNRSPARRSYEDRIRNAVTLPLVRIMVIGFAHHARMKAGVATFWVIPFRKCAADPPPASRPCGRTLKPHLARERSVKPMPTQSPSPRPDLPLVPRLPISLPASPFPRFFVSSFLRLPNSSSPRLPVSSSPRPSAGPMPRNAALSLSGRPGGAWNRLPARPGVPRYAPVASLFSGGNAAICGDMWRYAAISGGVPRYPCAMSRSRSIAGVLLPASGLLGGGTPSSGVAGIALRNHRLHAPRWLRRRLLQCCWYVPTTAGV